MSINNQNTSVNGTSLPKEWKWVKLKDIAKWGSGGTPRSTNPAYYNGDIPWLIIGDLNDGYIRSSEKRITKLGLDNSSAKLIKKDTVLIAMYGSIGKLGINKIPVATNQAIAYTEQLFENTYNKFLFHYLFHIRSKLHSLGKGGTQKNISQTVLKEVDFPLPPLETQQAIVSKIEELFSELDKGIENLKLAQQQLKTYRQSVLKWAFEGKLTESWRKSRVRVPSGPQVVMEANATVKNQKSVPKTGLNTKNFPAAPALLGGEPKPVSAEREGFEPPDLPDGWRKVTLGEVCYGVEYGSAVKSKSEGKMPVLRMGNIQNGRFDWTDLVYTDDDAEIRKYLLKKDDVLFNRTNSAELVGKTAIYKGERPAIFAGYLIRINRIENLIDATFLTFFLNSLEARRYGNSVRSFGVNQSNINGTKLKGYPILLPPIAEQEQIVLEIEDRLSVADKMEESITQSLQQAEALRQSILKKAFEGKLV